MFTTHFSYVVLLEPVVFCCLPRVHSLIVIPISCLFLYMLITFHSVCNYNVISFKCKYACLIVFQCVWFVLIEITLNAYLDNNLLLRWNFTGWSNFWNLLEMYWQHIHLTKFAWKLLVVITRKLISFMFIVCIYSSVILTSVTEWNTIIFGNSVLILIYT